MNCPRDREYLIGKELGNIEGKKCPKCNGIWIPYSALIKLYDEGLLVAPAKVYSENTAIHESKHWGSDIYCPTDGDKMKTYEYQDIHIDICHTCKGLWLDNGEIKKLWKGQTTSDEVMTWVTEIFGNFLISVIDV